MAARGNGHVVECEWYDAEHVEVTLLAAVGPGNVSGLNANDIERICRKARPGKYVGSAVQVPLPAQGITQS